MYFIADMKQNPRKTVEYPQKGAFMFRCPICAGELRCGGAAWSCAAGHSFDVARQGYVNLLPADRKHSRHPGDALSAVQARRIFLDGGHYAPLAERVAALAASPQTVLDAGCGEGYYLGAVGRTCPDALRIGVDISKDAVRYAAGRDKKAIWLTASAAALPMDDAVCDLVLCMFAYTFPEEFARVLRPDGRLIQVLAGENHLTALKSVIYPTILHREKERAAALPGFALTHTETLTFPLHLTDAGQVASLLAMTPHFWRITKEGAERAAALTALDDQAEMVINVYRREAAHG